MSCKSAAGWEQRGDGPTAPMRCVSWEWGGQIRMRRTVHVEEDDDAWQQQLQLPLDDGTLVLPGAPDVAPADGEQEGRRSG